MSASPVSSPFQSPMGSPVPTGSSQGTPARESTPRLLKHTKNDNLSKWYRHILKVADLAEPSVTPRQMIVKPLGMELWEQVQLQIDKILKQHGGGKNYSIPPQESCSSSCREIGEQLLNKWIQGAHNLPFFINQWTTAHCWNNPFTSPFSTAEELPWHEERSVFATTAEARDHAFDVGEAYVAFLADVCAIPVVVGEKPSKSIPEIDERIFNISAMIPNGLSMQLGTTHYQGLSFEESPETVIGGAYNTINTPCTAFSSISTRLIPTLILTHSDDYGLRIPPLIARHHVVIISSGKASPKRDAYIASIQQLFAHESFKGQPISVIVDGRSGVNAITKSEEWLKKGIPIRVIVSPFDVDQKKIDLYRRDDPLDKRQRLQTTAVVEYVAKALEEIQSNYYKEAEVFRNNHIQTDFWTLDQLKAFFSDQNNIGFVKANWYPDPETKDLLKAEYGVTVLCILNSQDTPPESPCILTGRPTTTEALFGRSY